MPIEIALPPNTEFIPVADVPGLIAEALHPDVSGQPLTVKYFTKTGLPGATGETAEWNGWPLDDNDFEVLYGITGVVAPDGETAEVVQPYIENVNSAGLDWELGAVWKNPELEAGFLRYTTEREHGQAIISAIRLGWLKVINPATRLPADEFLPSAVVSLENLTEYLKRLHISIRLDEREPAAKASPATKNIQDAYASNKEDWRVKARAIADELFDHDTRLNTRDQLGKKNARGEIVGGYSYRVMEKMQEKEIHGPCGRIDNAATIMREALQGKKWWANKPK